MAAGDIILSGGTTITAAEIQQIAAEVKKELAAESKELSQFEEVTSLANVSSLPGIQQSGATMKLVRVALEVLKGVDGKDVELTASSTAIQWRYVGESAWKTLVELSLLKGNKGDKGDKGDTGEKGDTGATGATGAQGEPGEKVMLRKGTSGIEWKYEGDGSWQTLVPMADLSFTFDELTEEQKQEISRQPILGTVEATKGDTPSGSFTSDGTDEHGNPKYKLNLVLPKGDKGDKGEPPVIEQGTVTTGNPGTQASVEVVPNGQTEQGNPKYILNFTIPKGDPGKDGEGAGNVYVVETGLQSGKKYLFQPGANNSANGTFVEYTEPEQVQPDWNATEGKGAILNKPSILPDAPKDGKQYARKDGAWAEVEAGDELSKEAIEQALTGNITTHRHDTTYQETTFETDVWDGTSISTSLQGSGTKDDPYLIQSCADWLHLYTNGAGQYNVYELDELETITEFKPVFKIVKNLDFGGRNIPEANTNSAIYACEIDGNDAKFSNFEPSGNTGILPTAKYSFLHNFAIDGFETIINASDGSEVIANIFSINDAYSTIINCSVKGRISINGDISEDTSYICILKAGGYMDIANQNMSNKILDYINNNGDYYGIDITLNDNTVKSNGAKMALVLTSYYSIHAANIYCSTKLDEYTVQEGGGPIFSKDTNVAYMCVGVYPGKLYTNSEGSNTIFIQSSEGQISEFHGTPKSLTEMQSESFVEELNSLLPKPAFKKDPEGGTPVLAQFGGIKYDGYVKQSEFEAFKAKLSVETPAEGSPFVDITLTTSQFPTDGAVIELNTEQYNTIKSGLLNGKILRVKAVCGIFFGSTTTIIPTDYGSEEVIPENSIPAVLIWATNPSEGIGGGAPISAVQFTVYFSKDPNESGNYEATFYEMKGNFVLSEEIDTIKKLTQSEYDGLSSKDSKTLYVIVG